MSWVLRFEELIRGTTARTLMVSTAIRKILIPPDSRHSRMFYHTCLGLLHYLRNGGRSRLEIEVDLHRYHFADSLWSI